MARFIKKLLLYLFAPLLLVSCQTQDTLPADRFATMKDGLRVHYKVLGDGKETIVFIPGWTNPLSVFQKQFDYFEERARCIYIDLPGHGESDAPEGVDYTMEFLADAIHTVLEAEGVDKFQAVGFSLGHIPLSQFNKKYPDRITRLVNIDGNFIPWPIEDSARTVFTAWREGFYSQMKDWDRDTKQQMVTAMIPENAPDDLKSWGAYFLDYPNELAANIWDHATRDEVNQPPNWSVPVLCIHSTPPDPNMMEAFYPNAEKHVIEDSGHVIQWENADEVNEMIEGFLLQ